MTTKLYGVATDDLFGAALDRAVPLVATSFGLSRVLGIAGLAYLIAIPAFFAVLRPVRRPAVWPASTVVTGAGSGVEPLAGAALR